MKESIRDMKCIRVIGKIKYRRVPKTVLAGRFTSNEVLSTKCGCKVCEMNFMNNSCILKICKKDTLCNDGEYFYVKKCR